MLALIALGVLVGAGVEERPAPGSRRTLDASGQPVGDWTLHFGDVTSFAYGNNFRRDIRVSWDSPSPITTSRH